MKLGVVSKQQTRCTWRNSEVRLHNHCKLQYETLHVSTHILVLIIWHANRRPSVPCYIVTCALFWLHHISLHYLIYGTISGSMLLSIKCVSSSSLQLFPEISLFLRRIQRENIINVHRYSCKVCIILVILEWNFHFTKQIFKKILQYQISWISDQWELSCSTQDRHDKTNSHFLGFCEHTSKVNAAGTSTIWNGAQIWVTKYKYY